MLEKIAILNPFSDQYSAIEDFKKLMLIEKIVTVVLTVLVSLPTFCVSTALVFRCLVKKFSKKEGSLDGIYFVRYLNIRPSLPKVTVDNLKEAVALDIGDQVFKGRYKGACLYTSNSVQPLAAFDPRVAKVGAIAVAYPFALLINPKVELHYWSLVDMDRNKYESDHKEGKETGASKYKPDFWHNVYETNKWKTVHFTGVESFIKKIECIAEAVKKGQSFYLTPGGKQKSLAEVEKCHNEGAITYNPEKDTLGILVKNDPVNIALAEEFKKNYVDKNGKHVFRSVFLAYQQVDGKIIKL